MKSPLSVDQECFTALKLVANNFKGQIKLCRKKSVIFQSNAPCTCAFCTFWGVDITPKPPSGHHASVGMTQQLERLALIFTLFLPTNRFSTVCDAQNLYISNHCIGGSRGRARRAPPKGPDSFVLTYKIFET